MVIVQRDMSQQHLRHIQPEVETVGVENIADAAVDPLDHAVRFSCPALGQPMFDAKPSAQQVTNSVVWHSGQVCNSSQNVFAI